MKQLLQSIVVNKGTYQAFLDICNIQEATAQTYTSETRLLGQGPCFQTFDRYVLKELQINAEGSPDEYIIEKRLDRVSIQAFLNKYLVGRHKGYSRLRKSCEQTDTDRKVCF